jgi:hypothetical protein
MTPFLSGFAAELVKLGETKDPTAKVNGKMDKLLKGGLSKYIGEQDVRTPTFPPMEEVANRSFKDKSPKVDFRAPKPPKVK